MLFSERKFTSTDEIKPVICDGGATSTLSSSFENCTDCQPKTVEIKTAEGGVVMTTTHVCMKTYYVKSRTGEIRPLTTNIPFIQRDKSKSFAFMSEHSIFFYIKAEAMSAHQFGKISGYEKWHRRLGHTLTTNRDIHDTIPYVRGLEELTNKSYHQHTKCASCMIGKSTLENFPKLRSRADKPLKQVNIDSFSSSVVSIEGYSHAVVIMDCLSGYRWLYGMKTKDDMLKVIKKWYSDIADIRQKHDLVVVMRDNAGENKSHEIMEFIQSTGARNHFSSSYEQWQNGLAEGATNSIMRLARTVMAESGLGGRFWFKAALVGKDTRNVTYKQRLWQTPYSCIYCELKDVSRFRAFGCRARVYLNTERREKGKHTPRAQEAIYLGFEPNTRAWSFFIPERQTLWSTNQVQLDEHVFGQCSLFAREDSEKYCLQVPKGLLD